MRSVIFAIYDLCPYVVRTQEVKEMMFNLANASPEGKKQFSRNKHRIQSTPLTFFCLRIALLHSRVFVFSSFSLINSGWLGGSDRILFTYVSVLLCVMPGSSVLHKCFSQ